MPHPDHYRKLEHMYTTAPINAFFRPHATIAEGHCEVTMPLRPDFHHAAGAAHGAVYFKMLDDATFFAANSLIEDVFVLTVSFNLYLLRPISSGMVRAVATVVSHSARLIVAEGEVFNEAGKVVAKGSGSFMPGRSALTPEIGYQLPPDFTP